MSKENDLGKMELFSDDGPVLGINSLGRIGKLSLWHHVGRKYFKKIVVNQGREIGTGLHAAAQFIEKDSTYGLLHHFLHGNRASRVIEIVDEERGELRIDGIPVILLRRARNPKEIPWREHGARIVIDCTGQFKDPTVPTTDPKGSIRGHLAGGAEKVINSAPFKIKDKSLGMPEDAAVFIFGINHTSYNPRQHHILSAASCTTTGLAHMVLPLIHNFETRYMMTASMSTIHAVTNTQSVLDSVPKTGAADLRKSRSILNNIILTSTGAAKALEQVIPEVKSIGFMADSVRIPTDTESLIVLNITFQSKLNEMGDSNITQDVLNNLYKAAAEGDQKGLLQFTMEQNVSSDLIGNSAAVVIEGHDTHTRTGFVSINLSEIPEIPPALVSSLDNKVLHVPVTHAKIFGWYDNEYGSYTNRLADLTVHVHSAME